MSSNMAEIEQAIREVYDLNREALADYMWESEDERWQELAVCLISEGCGVPYDGSRRIAGLLSELGVLSVPVLIDMDRKKKEFVAEVLQQLGVASRDAIECVKLLSNVAKIVSKKWDGYIQRFLRVHGRKMEKELSSALVEAGLPADKAAQAATLWLQNVANLPILLPSDPHIRAFCSEVGASEKQLLEAADRQGINVAVLDDLLRVSS